MPNRCLFLFTLVAGASLIPHAAAQTPRPVRLSGLCGTGLTPKSAPPKGCLTSKLITPINPTDGGSIVDRNWDLAFPAPSVPYNQPAPNPCVFTAAYRPTPVSAPNGGWYDPDNGLSQWMEPEDGSNQIAAGWYLYRTSFPIPQAQSGSSLYRLEVTGQFLADDYLYAIYLADPSMDEAACREVATFTNTSDFHGWQPFQLGATVAPDTQAYLYFLVFNSGSGNSATGLRVEFISPFVVPY